MTQGPCSYSWCPYRGAHRVRRGQQVVFRACTHHRALFQHAVRLVRYVMQQAVAQTEQEEKR